MFLLFLFILIYRHNNGNIILHEEIDGGAKSFNRLPMTIDSITILNRRRQRKRVIVEQHDNNLIELGSGIHRLVTSNDCKQQNVSLSIECEQDEVEKKLFPHPYESFSLDEEDSNSIKTLNTDTINTKSYNTSAHTKQQRLKEVFDNLHQKKKRMSRSPAEHGKHRQKRKRYKQKSKVLISSINMKSSFFNNLFLLRQNKETKSMIIMRNHTRKKSYIKSIKAKNLNLNSNDQTVTLNAQSIENLSCEFLIYSQFSIRLFFL